MIFGGLIFSSLILMLILKYIIRYYILHKVFELVIKIPLILYWTFRFAEYKNKINTNIKQLQ